MTEESYQQGRKIMQQANYRRGLITKAIGEVAKWTKITMANISNKQPAKASGSQLILDKALEKLAQRRAAFSELQFPDSNIPDVKHENTCDLCGEPATKGEKYCGECSLKYKPLRSDFKDLKQK